VHAREFWGKGDFLRQLSRASYSGPGKQGSNGLSYDYSKLWKKVVSIKLSACLNILGLPIYPNRE
jgi:hypothetical protein